MLYEPLSFCSSLKFSVDSPNGLRTMLPSFFKLSIISAFIFSFLSSILAGSSRTALLAVTFLGSRFNTV